MRAPLLVAFGCGLFAACTGAPPPPPAPEPVVVKQPAEPPHRIVVDHILIAVANPRMPNVRRSAEEARKFAYDLLAKIRAGADWGEAKRANSDDPPPGGPYGMVDNTLPAQPPNWFRRDMMVPAFGDVGFALAVGEIGMADYDKAKSPFGFHLIKRVE